MSRSLFIAALLTSSIMGIVVCHAQSGDTKCGPVAYDSAKQTYVGIPCSSAATPNSTDPNANTAKAPAQKCGPVAYDAASQTYVGIPCTAGTTDENPAGRSQ